VWEPITPRLVKHFTVYRIDLPGHGDSPRLRPGADASADGFARTIAEWLDENDIVSPHVAGSSLGGWIALELARQGLARSVCALAPAGFWRSDVVPVVAHANRWAARIADPFAPTLLRVGQLKSIGFWTSSANPASLDRDLAVAATHAQSRASGWAAALAATHGRQCDARDIDPRIPVTAVWGDRDRILPGRSCQEPEGLPLHARWVRLRDCGHVPMWDQPERTAQLIEQTAAATHLATAK
ncbi:MAG TPA: alpha/beta fold hydrolase, partial [Actinomycetes bacterium]|nr:alpha/beta fold hydrolase [Actinomycetes bacterium]